MQNPFLDCLQRHCGAATCLGPLVAQVRWWDVTQGSQLNVLRGHTDYVRAACLSPADSSCWATGECAHTCHTPHAAPNI